MVVQIRETIETPDASGSVVQLQISDVPPPYEDAEIVIRLSVRLPRYKLPLIAQLQRAAMECAVKEMEQLLQDLAAEIQATHHNLRPAVKP